MLACAACGTTASGGDSPHVAAAMPTESVSPSANPSPSATAQPSVVVDWDSGKGTQAEPEVNPSPRGWYEAAFGGPPESQGKVLYVTFDDGPGTETQQVLDLLAEHHAKATFFVVGRQLALHPRMVKREQQAGHAVGNHTWSHPDLANLSSKHVKEQLTLTAAAVPGMGHCMRPPYGSIDATAGQAATELGFQPILWTDQAWDWKPPTVDKIVGDLKAGTKPGAVILLHDGADNRGNTVAALKKMLPSWASQGYVLKAIPACS